MHLITDFYTVFDYREYIWNKGLLLNFLLKLFNTLFNRATLASWVLSKLPKCFISRWTHSWCMNQLFHNIFKPKENFFLEGFVCWRHECAQWEYEARSRNWIWLDIFTSYVIIWIASRSLFTPLMCFVCFISGELSSSCQKWKQSHCGILLINTSCTVTWNAH